MDDSSVDITMMNNDFSSPPVVGSAQFTPIQFNIELQSIEMMGDTINEENGSKVSINEMSD